MTPQAQLAMLAWIPVMLYLFARFPVQKAVVIGFVGAWLFLPQKAGFSFPGFPDYNRISAASYGILLATCIFDVGRFHSFKLRWLDLPMLIWCVCPIASSMSNGLGFYDGFSSALSQTVQWGFPYFLGRIYFNDLKGLRLLALGIFLGGIIYVPLCLFEVRMSPQLHSMVYGYFPHSFAQTMRYGGFRPQVFMQHGLAVGVWMMAATLVGIWLWQAGVIKQVWGISMSWLVPVLLITFILCKSTGAWFLCAFGLIILLVARQLGTALPLLLLIGGIFFYPYYVATGQFTQPQQDQIISVMTEITNEDRASSLKARFDNEQIFGEKARQQIIFGWGGWGRSWVYLENWAGEPVAAALPDSLWIIVFGTNGLVGLFSFIPALCLPILIFCWRYPARLWFNPRVAPAAVVAVVVTLYMADNLTNDMFNPVFPLASGGIAGVVLQETQTRNVKRRLLTTKHSLAQRR
ncbi:O-antigen ligase domain-containing protein [Coleofasciculus sp.]|uniref:O-antigen ligase domain-containing protein n=1 Tax=Coleofasciculus sp. TaxID=3100458 RepID=UPI0039F848BC